MYSCSIKKVDQPEFNLNSIEVEFDGRGSEMKSNSFFYVIKKDSVFIHSFEHYNVIKIAPNFKDKQSQDYLYDIKPDSNKIGFLEGVVSLKFKKQICKEVIRLGIDTLKINRTPYYDVPKISIKINYNDSCKYFTTWNYEHRYKILISLLTDSIFYEKLCKTNNNSNFLIQKEKSAHTLLYQIH
ncbi:MAG: hypothetical protein RI955_867 [Bacteroidota bacterium]|jgi:hypothetical protein